MWTLIDLRSIEFGSYILIATVHLWNQYIVAFWVWFRTLANNPIVTSSELQDVKWKFMVSKFKF